MEELTQKEDSVQLRMNGCSAEVISASIEQNQLDKSLGPKIYSKDSLARFFLCPDKDQPPSIENIRYSDAEIQQIADLLRHINTAWSKVPRTYAVLRIVKQLHHLDEFIHLGFTDHWLPVTPRQMPESLGPTARQNFLIAQSTVLTKVTDLENGEDGKHKHFAKDEPSLFQTLDLLGSGGFGQVEKVVSKLSNNEYARKRIRREKLFHRSRESMKSFISELEILKRVDHYHIVKLVGSYTDPNYLGLIMSPIADCNLASYFSTDFAPADKKGRLRTFFGCLAKALQYLHNVGIRHKDIKPQNILVKGDTVLLTDFGISFSAAESGRSTTEGETAITLRYCAPEVVNYEPRNSSSDIWSLGCVFMEMVTVLKDQTIQSVREYLESHGSRGQFFFNNQEATKEWVLMLSAIEPHSDNKPLQWVQNMLEYDRHLRPKALALVKDILSDPSAEFCGSCCIGPYLDQTVKAIGAH